MTGLVSTMAGKWRIVASLVRGSRFRPNCCSFIFETRGFQCEGMNFMKERWENFYWNYNCQDCLSSENHQIYDMKVKGIWIILKEWQTVIPKPSKYSNERQFVNTRNSRSIWDNSMSKMKKYRKNWGIWIEHNSLNDYSSSNFFKFYRNRDVFLTEIFSERWHNSLNDYLIRNFFKF